VARKTPNNAKLKTIQAADIDIALHMLTTYLNAKDISPLLSSLEALKADPRNESRQEQVSEAFHGLRSVRRLDVLEFINEVCHLHGLGAVAGKCHCAF